MSVETGAQTPPRLVTRLTRRFGLAHPVLNAPMALVAGGRLAGAVTRAGGLGLIGGGYAGTLGGEPVLEEEFARAEGAKVGIGFITWTLAAAPDMLARALALRPACLFLSFTDPRPYAAAIHAAGVPLICQVQSRHEVDAALDAAPVAIVAQGTEAGGHGGGRATLSFVPEVADLLARRAPDVLLLAAGGIADGRGLAAALLLGADGVVVGSRFWAADEALTPEAAVARASAASGDDTVRTRAIDALRDVPWPADYSFRVLRNRVTDAWAGREAEALASRGQLRDAYRSARASGDLDVLPVVAGEAVGLIAAREPADVLVNRMVLEAAALLTRATPLDFT